MGQKMASYLNRVAVIFLALCMILCLILNLIQNNECLQVMSTHFSTNQDICSTIGEWGRGGQGGVETFIIVIDGRGSNLGHEVELWHHCQPAVYSPLDHCTMEANI